MQTCPAQVSWSLRRGEPGEHSPTSCFAQKASRLVQQLPSLPSAGVGDEQGSHSKSYAFEGHHDETYRPRETKRGRAVNLEVLQTAKVSAESFSPQDGGHSRSILGRTNCEGYWNTCHKTPGNVYCRATDSRMENGDENSNRIGWVGGAKRKENVHSTDYSQHPDGTCERTHGAKLSIDNNRKDGGQPDGPSGSTNCRIRKRSRNPGGSLPTDRNHDQYDDGNDDLHHPERLHRHFFASSAVVPRATITSIFARTRAGGRRRPLSAQSTQKSNSTTTTITTGNNVKPSQETEPRPRTVDSVFRMLGMRWRRSERHSNEPRQLDLPNHLPVDGHQSVPGSPSKISTRLEDWLGAPEGTMAANVAAANALAAVAELSAASESNTTEKVQHRGGHPPQKRQGSTDFPPSAASPSFAKRMGSPQDPALKHGVGGGRGSLRPGLTAEALERSSVALDKSGRVTFVDQVR